MNLIKHPPAADAGQMSPSTALLRPPEKLPPRERINARKMAKAGLDAISIAAALGCAEDAVLQATAAMRTQKANRSRSSLNVTLETAQFVEGQQMADEAIWETTGRLFGELIQLRTEIFVLRAKKP